MNRQSYYMWVAFQCWRITYCSMEMSKNCKHRLFSNGLLSCTDSGSSMKNKMDDDCGHVFVISNQ